MTKYEEVLKWYWYQPPPQRSGENAGTRKREGITFQAAMRGLLARPLHHIDTVVGKSSDGETLDGNASERTSYKMLRFKRDPLNLDYTLVLALNVSFERYRNAQIWELKDQITYLNAQPGGSILLLSTPEDYRRYMMKGA